MPEETAITTSSAEKCIAELTVAIDKLDEEYLAAKWDEPSRYIKALSNMVLDIHKNGTGAYNRLLETRLEDVIDQVDREFQHSLIDTVAMIQEQLQDGIICVQDNEVSFAWNRMSG